MRMKEEFVMDSKKEFVNVKIPAYAVKLGSGCFVGAIWMCIKCGKQTSVTNNMPSPTYGGRCPDTASGNHVWQRC